MMRSDASLKGKIKALAKKSNLKPQELLQMYLFEHLLMRLGKSGYAEAFVLKGGLLISSMTGVAQRTTMDMDTTVIGMDMDEDTVSEAVAAICAVDIADGMEYSFERILPKRMTLSGLQEFSRLDISNHVPHAQVGRFPSTSQRPNACSWSEGGGS